jgi:hypothetical protein
MKQGAAGVHKKCEVQIFQPIGVGLSVKKNLNLVFVVGFLFYFLPKQKVKS